MPTATVEQPDVVPFRPRPARDRMETGRLLRIWEGDPSVKLRILPSLATLLSSAGKTDSTLGIFWKSDPRSLCQCCAKCTVEKSGNGPKEEFFCTHKIPRQPSEKTEAFIKIDPCTALDMVPRPIAGRPVPHSITVMDTIPAPGKRTELKLPSDKVCLRIAWTNGDEKSCTRCAVCIAHKCWWPGKLACFHVVDKRPDDEQRASSVTPVYVHTCVDKPEDFPAAFERCGLPAR
jgi:hypothetical protein